jgi:hypothetical protein
MKIEIKKMIKVKKEIDVKCKCGYPLQLENPHYRQSNFIFNPCPVCLQKVATDILSAPSMLKEALNKAGVAV